MHVSLVIFAVKTSCISVCCCNALVQYLTKSFAYKFGHFYIYGKEARNVVVHNSITSSKVKQSSKENNKFVISSEESCNCETMMSSKAIT